MYSNIMELYRSFRYTKLYIYIYYTQMIIQYAWELSIYGDACRHVETDHVSKRGSFALTYIPAPAFHSCWWGVGVEGVDHWPVNGWGFNKWFNHKNGMMIPKDRFFQRGGSTIRYSSNGELLFLFRCTMPFYAFFFFSHRQILGSSTSHHQLSWRPSWKSPFLPSTGADRIKGTASSVLGRRMLGRVLALGRMKFSWNDRAAGPSFFGEPERRCSVQLTKSAVNPICTHAVCFQNDENRNWATKNAVWFLPQYTLFDLTTLKWFHPELI